MNLLELPADERAELAMALWDSLTGQERESELELSSPVDDDVTERPRTARSYLALPIIDWSLC